MSEKSRVPEPLENLYRDLRDRRMLPLVALLLVAIVAVPILLGTDAEPAPTSAAALSSGDAASGLEGVEGTEITEPVVLAEVPGIRDFRKRLDSFRERNPFEQQYTGLPGSVADAQRDAEKKAEEEAGAPADGSGTGESGPGSTDTGADGGGAVDGGNGSGAGGDSGGGAEPGATTKTYAYLWEIDAKVGVVGDAEHKDGVEQLEFLPGKSHPVVQFIRGIGESAAIFVVSRSVGDTHGDGRCRPHPDNCQFLALEPGQSRTFEYEPNGLRYKIKLTGVHLERKQVDPKDVDAFRDEGLDEFVSGG